MQLKPPVGKTDHTQGNQKATVEIVEYGDYQCPYCGAAYPVIKELMQQSGQQVKFVFRNFPLSEIHPYALPAALAAEAAALQGKFWEMHDAIYEQQQYLDEEFLFSLAGQLKLDLRQFKQDVQLASLAARIDKDFESGVTSGVNGTPTFFVNGKKFNGGAEELSGLLSAKAE